MALLSSLLVPTFVQLTSNVSDLVDLSSADELLIAIFGGLLISIGNRFIYKTGDSVSASDIIEEIGKAIVGPNGKIVNYLIDGLLVIFCEINFGLPAAMYSLISITIIEVMSKRSSLGISESKVFYIITQEEAKVKKFIMNELHYDLTIFDAKGGFSKNKTRILMSAIPTKDYYRLREGIKDIDPKAFISITDSYELINENISISAR